ncbi:MAG: YlmH/Sll1252 family protein [Eubacteriales bacterium]|nr:YlmH/Sll1252 family protein [Eubacteriales bacterium]
MKEDAILLAGIEDKIRQCLAYDITTNSAFLDMRQRTLAESLCRQQIGLRYCFCGGYEDAERRMAVFFADDAEPDEENPMALLRITQAGGRPLSHRDYLGALTGLGVKRETIGDILVRDDGADIVIMKDMAEFLLCHYGKAGRTPLKAEIVPIEEIIVPENRFEEKKDTVASLRLDNLIASAFSMSRGKAAETIAGGMVFVNGLQTEKADRQIKEGDKLVLRGKGKALLKTVGNVTKKNRISIVLHKYV